MNDARIIPVYDISAVMEAGIVRRQADEAYKAACTALGIEPLTLDDGKTVDWLQDTRFPRDCENEEVANFLSLAGEFVRMARRIHREATRAGREKALAQ
jgi:hypothetical protein